MISDETVYKTVDYQKVYSNANELLVSNHVIEMFPFKANKLLQDQSDIRLCSYKKALDKYGVNVKTFGSESAVWQEYEGANIIFYNEREAPYRIRFDIMHEFGHFRLDHVMNLDADDPLYQKQELEANCFAAQILMPEQIIRECIKRGKNNSIHFLKSSFDVSEDAAVKRRKTLANTNPEWKSRAEQEYDDIILLRYATFLDVIAPKYDNKYSSYYYEDEYALQERRNSWYDERGRW